MTSQRPRATPRALVLGLVAVIVVLGLAVVMLAIGRSAAPTQPGEVDALANSADECVVCHRNTTPGIIQQYGHSTMAAAKVTCRDCHAVRPDYPGAVEHEGTYVLQQPTTAMCEKCHSAEAAQFNQSRHGLPAYVAVAGSQALPQSLLALYNGIPEAQFQAEKGPSSRNIIASMEGPEITRFACESCHNIGKPASDDSVGQCQKCHQRHEFSLEQARRPETCNNCHIGPDHPQWEIYFESKHGIAYSTGGDTWNWAAEPGTLTVQDFPAPTCATCHFSGFGGAGTTHDAGDRLTWFLFAAVSERRPAWQDNQVRMQSVCKECHNANFIETFYTNADAATESVNGFIRQSDAIKQSLVEQGLLTEKPLDEAFDFIHYETWHHFGRTAKFGVWMQGADYTQWHGAYEVVKGVAELQEIANEKMEKAGK
jgi:nitrate/TMAO reductase-like tetraheme cytochrome c subunit